MANFQTGSGLFFAGPLDRAAICERKATGEDISLRKIGRVTELGKKLADQTYL
jgi:hypothetical protein